MTALEVKPRLKAAPMLFTDVLTAVLTEISLCEPRTCATEDTISRETKFSIGGQLLEFLTEHRGMIEASKIKDEL